MHLLAIFLLILSTSVYGAALDLEALDYKSCARWAITSDTGGAKSSSYETALSRANGSSGLSVFSAVILRDDGQAFEKYGACSYVSTTVESRFECLANQDYPLAGSVFVSKKTSKAPNAKVLKCVAGCKGMPDVVHEIDQDIVDNMAFVKSERRRMSVFRSKCGSK